MTEIKPTWIELCRTAFDEERFEDVVAFAEQSLLEPVNDPEIYKNIGNAFCNLNRHKESIRFYEKALNVEPRYFEASYNLGVYYKIHKRDFHKAIKCFVLAYKVSRKKDLRKNIWCMLQLTSVYFLLDEHDKADLIIESLNESNLDAENLQYFYVLERVKCKLMIWKGARLIEFTARIIENEAFSLDEKKKVFLKIIEYLMLKKSEDYGKACQILQELSIYEFEEYQLSYELAKMYFFTQQDLDSYKQLRKISTLPDAIEKYGKKNTFEKIKEEFVSDVDISFYIAFDLQAYAFECLTSNNEEQDFIDALFNHTLLYLESSSAGEEIGARAVWVNLAMALHWNFNKKAQAIDYIKNYISKAVTEEEKFVYTLFLAKCYLLSKPEKALKLLGEAHSYINYAEIHPDSSIMEQITYLKADIIIASAE